MRVGSLFSGIGGLDLGLERAGMEVVWQVEIDPFRRGLLARRWPSVERFEDVRGVRGAVRQKRARKARGRGASTQGAERADGKGRRGPAGADRRADTTGAANLRGRKPSIGNDSRQLSAVDLICGGFPCQDLSVAGRRAGLQGARSGLFFEFARILGEVRPRWCLIENVPGLLSSNGGDDFRIVLDALQGIGYGVSWRVLDSRHFGVPQRRRRVYIVGSLGDLRSAAVLFEPEGGGGDTAAGREAGEGVAATIGGRASSHSATWKGADHETYVPVAHALSAKRSRSGRYDPTGESYIVGSPADADGVREAAGVPRRVDPRPRQLAFGKRTRAHTAESADETWGETETANPLTVDQRPTTLAAPLEAADGHHGRSSPRGDGADNLVAAPIRGRSHGDGVNPPSRGGEDDENIVASPITAGYKKGAGVNDGRKGSPQNLLTGVAQPAGQDGADGVQGDDARPCCPDGPRYAALGDAVTVNVAEWIGRRIVMAEQSQKTGKAN